MTDKTTTYRYHGSREWLPLPLPSGDVWLSPNDTAVLTVEDIEWLKKHDLFGDFRKPFKGIPDYGTRLSNAPSVEFAGPKPKHKPTRRAKQTKMSDKDGD